MTHPLIDTHTHFDIAVFDHDRAHQAQLAWQRGVRHLLLIGYMAKYFEQMVRCQQQMRSFVDAGVPSPQAHLAFGLHPFYILEHSEQDLITLEQNLQRYPSVAIGEIGLDTFTDEMKVPAHFDKQQDFFMKQLDLATRYKLPVLLHIRRSHAEALKCLKQHKFKYGGIAHSFSGGIQEAKAFVALGFKIGVTGQVTNPNAKKLRSTLIQLAKAVGLTSLVIETDCPDMMPLACQQAQTIPHQQRRNVPANLPFVLDELAVLLSVDKDELAATLWQNSLQALQLAP